MVLKIEEKQIKKDVALLNNFQNKKVKQKKPENNLRMLLRLSKKLTGVLKQKR